MANFAPSIHFAKHWKNTPKAVKQAFYDELNDIIALLDGHQSIQDFSFRQTDFDQAIALLLDNEPGQETPTKLVHSLDVTPLANHKPKLELTATDIEILQDQLQQKLLGQLNDFLDEHFTQLSGDLHEWVKIAINNELTPYQRQD